LSGNTSCTQCDAGQYMSRGGAVNCLDCNPGDFQNLTGAESCENCLENSFTNSSGLSSCYLCQIGEKSDPGSAKCTSCDAGEAGMGDNGACQACDAGQFRASNDVITDSCTPCKSGHYQTSTGQTSCLPCIPGTYENDTGSTKCKDCPISKYTDQSKQTNCKQCGKEETSKNGSTFCTKCEAGQYMSTNNTCAPCSLGTVSTYGQSSCFDCTAGYYSNDDNSTCDACDPGKYSHETRAKDNSTCQQCPVGTYSSAKGVNNVLDCNLCTPGQYSVAVGNNKACSSCPNGWLQANQGQDHCIQPDFNAIVGPGGTSQQEVAEGWVKDACNLDGSHCTSSKPCKPGTISTPSRNACADCDAGTTSFKGSASCIPCAKGKFTDEKGSLCANCPIGFFQPQERKPSQSCLRCPIGWKQEEEGAALCNDPGGIKPENCGDDEYWVPDKFPDKDAGSQAGCKDCPDGGSCIGAIGKAGVRALFGWWKIPENERDSATNEVFAECLFPPACLGGRNPDLLDRYPKAAAISTPYSPLNGTCNVALGFRNTSRLCQTCASGYSRTSQSTCVACNNNVDGSKSIIVVLAAVGMLLLFIGMNVLRMRSFRSFDAQRRRKSLHSTIKRIVLSHIQMIGIVLGLSVPWPTLMREVLQTTSSVASFSEGVNGFECLYQDMDHAKFYNGVLLFTALGPLLFAGIIGVYWFALAQWVDGLKCGSKVKRGKFCPKRNQTTVATTTRVTYTDADAFISSAVLLWYLSLPSLLQISTGSLKCWPVGNQNYIFIDLEKNCFHDDHLLFSLLVACPTILLYGGVLPGYFMFRLHRAGSARLTDPSLMLRWGMLHSGYREKKFWWETIVLLRKYTIILLVTFNNRGEFQLHIALGILFLALHFHDSQHPFGHRRTAASNATLHRYEMASLLILLFMLWCASFFSLGVCTHEAGWCTFMVVLVLGSNFGLIGGLVIMYGKAWCKRNHLHKKISKFVRKSFSRKSTVGSTTGTGGGTGVGTGVGTGGGDSGNSNGEVKLPEKSQVPVDTSTQKKRRLSSRELMLEMTNQKHRIAEHDEEAINVFITSPIRSHSKEGVAAHTPVGESGGKTQQRVKRSSPNHFANVSSSKEMRARQNESGGGGGNAMGEEVKTVLDVEVGGEEKVIVILGVNPMHAARGEATPTAPETATPTAARARWNKLKQVTKTPRRFRNGGKQQRMKRLSNVMKARQHESGGGSGGSKSIGVKTIVKVEAAVSIHVDEVSGRRYSYNEATGHTQWPSDDDKGDEATIEEQGESTNMIRIAAFDYVAAESGELDMIVGDKIELLGAINDDDDWGKGKNLRTGNVGDCPVGYLEFDLPV
jgi:hypothetical protein